MTDFGARLREQRESRNITLEEIAESTKIGKRYLQALESNDFAALPGGVFAKGYLRTYAEAIGVDPEPLLEEYLRERRELDGGDPTEDEHAAHDAAQAALSRMAWSDPSPPASNRPPLRVLVLAVLAVGLVAVLAWTAIRFFRSDDGEARVATVAEKPEPARDEPVAKSPPPPQPEEAEPVVEQTVTPPPAATKAETQPPPREEPPVETQPEVVTEPKPAPPKSTPVAETQPAAVAETMPTPPKQTPSPAPPVETVAEPVAVESRLSIPEYGVGTDVVDRQLVGRSDRFAAGSRVWFWTRVHGGSPGTTIRHVWLRDGREVGNIELNVGGSHWRTQSRWTLPAGATGSWSVEARDANGRVLAKADFTCE